MGIVYLKSDDKGEMVDLVRVEEEHRNLNFHIFNIIGRTIFFQGIAAFSSFVEVKFVDNLRLNAHYAENDFENLSRAERHLEERRYQQAVAVLRVEGIASL